ncbi:MAG: HlyC/CorC family transporter, partial [Enterococcus faecium]
TNFTTLAGFASSRYKEIKAGTIIEIASFRFTVLEYQHAHIDYFKVESTERKIE